MQDLPKSPLVWAPPVLLTIVAIAQIAISQTTTLSSWKGGGFGMFATTDQSFARYIAAHGTTEDGRDVGLKLRFRTDNDVLPKKVYDRVRAFPRTNDLTWIGRSLLSRRLISDRPDRRTVYRLKIIADAGASADRFATLDEVRLQMWARRLDIAHPPSGGYPKGAAPKRLPGLEAMLNTVRAKHGADVVASLRIARVYNARVGPRVVVKAGDER